MIYEVPNKSRVIPCEVSKDVRAHRKGGKWGGQGEMSLGESYIK